VLLARTADSSAVLVVPNVKVRMEAEHYIPIWVFMTCYKKAFMKKNTRNAKAVFFFLDGGQSIIRGFSLFARVLEPNPRVKRGMIICRLNTVAAVSSKIIHFYLPEFIATYTGILHPGDKGMRIFPNYLFARLHGVIYQKDVMVIFSAVVVSRYIFCIPPSHLRLCISNVCFPLRFSS
jgi:hypothetical protein